MVVVSSGSVVVVELVSCDSVVVVEDGLGEFGFELFEPPPPVYLFVVVVVDEDVSSVKLTVIF